MPALPGWTATAFHARVAVLCGEMLSLEARLVEKIMVMQRWMIGLGVTVALALIGMGVTILLALAG